MTFPRTMIGNLSVSRMIIGVNWFLGFSHTSAAKDKLIKEVMSQQRIADIIEVFLDAGIDTIMGPIQIPGLREAIAEAEQRTSHGCIIISTPAINIADEPEAFAQAEQTFDKEAALGAAICMPHQMSTDRLVDMRERRIKNLRQFKPHTLTESEEQIITLKDVNGIDALMTIYDMITNRFTFALEVDGQRRTMTRDELSAYARHPVADVRAAAYRELYRVYAESSTILAEIYNTRVRDWQAEMLQLRHYAEPISARNLVNDIPDAVTDVLLSVCQQNNHLFQRYFRLKAKWLGLDPLRRYDIYAPLIEAEKKYDYATSVEMVLSSFRDFSPTLADHARRVLADGHVDSALRPGKRGGAFCYGVLPAVTPWVLINFSGRARDVATLAHELGHAVHALMAADHSLLTFHSSLPLAETASTFSEILLTERLLRDETDPAVRRDLLASMIDDAYATVQRQAYFTLFEHAAHRLVVAGKSVDEISTYYLSTLAEQFGDSVEIGDEFKWEWISIPHIYHTPFYTYAYSFGQLLVYALYQRYRSEGETFKPKYLKILAYGGSESPARILSEAGIDIASPAFWQGGFDVIRGLIDDLERPDRTVQTKD